MSHWCNNKGISCENATDIGYCQLSACAKPCAPSNREEEIPRRSLIRCQCGNVLAGYDGNILTISRKGRNVTFRSECADVTVMCEKCGRTTKILVNKPYAYYTEGDK